jgi:hypothetical protein
MKSIIKKVLLSVAATLSVAVLIPASSFALSPKTDVTGTVYYNGHTVAGALVTVICDSNVKHDTTDANGVYLVQYSATACPEGATATVVATKGKKGGTSDTVIKSTTDKLNVNLVNVDLPEFGVVAGFGAAVLGGAAFLVIRRKQLGQN